MCANPAIVSLLVRLWVEINILVLCTDWISSASSWGCELKSWKNHADEGTGRRSASSWGCELKCTWVRIPVWGQASCEVAYSNLVVVGTKQRVQYLVEELRETQIVMKEITEQILSGDFSMSGECYKELKEDYLAFVITIVDILNGAAYLSDKKPDSDNRHWKEQQEI